MKIIKIVLLISLIFVDFINISSVFAQDELLVWFQAPLGKMPPMGFYSLSYYGDRDVKDQDESFKLIEHNIFGMVPVINKENKDLIFLGTYVIKDMDTEAILPKANTVLPNRLYDLNIGPAYRYQFANGWTGGIAFMLGSASDKMFHSKDEFAFRADVYLRIPTVNKNAWVIFVDYSNNREYLRNIPIPGAGYWYEPSTKMQAFIGLPVAMLNYKLTENLTFESYYIMVTDVKAKLSYTLIPSFRANQNAQTDQFMAGKLTLYGEFQWNNELYTRADRERKKDRLFYYEKLLSAGINFRPFKYLSIDLSAGYCFDNFFFEGDDYNKKEDNMIDIKNGPFARFSISAPF